MIDTYSEHSKRFSTNFLACLRRKICFVDCLFQMSVPVKPFFKGYSQICCASNGFITQFKEGFRFDNSDHFVRLPPHTSVVKIIWRSWYIASSHFLLITITKSLAYTRISTIYTSVTSRSSIRRAHSKRERIRHWEHSVIARILISSLIWCGYYSALHNYCDPVAYHTIYSLFKATWCRRMILRC